MSEFEEVDDLLGERRADLEEEHGEVIAIQVKKHLLVFRLPTRTESRRYRQTVARGKAQNDDLMEALLKSCCVEPGPEGFDAVMEKYSMALGSIGISFMKGAGFDMDTVK